MSNEPKNVFDCICEGENGLYITYPFPYMPMTSDDDFKSSVLPITKSLREHVKAVVIEKYQDAVKKENG